MMDDPVTADVASDWFGQVGEVIVAEVDRLWPEEDDIGFRVGNLAEEVGEVTRAVTKRRHAEHAADGLCKGMTVDQWTEELRAELFQLAGVIVDIAHREGFDLVDGLEWVAATLQVRERGT